MNRFILFVLLTQWQLMAQTTWPAASPSLADVVTAYGFASDGDTVTIPAGTATWTSRLTISKAITLQGAGKTLTTITDGVTSDILMEINLVANLNTRMTGIGFVDGGGAGFNRIYINGTNIDNRRIRVDNCKFDQLSYSVFMIETALGVIDSNDFIRRTGVAVIFAHVKGSSWGAAQGTSAFGDGAIASADQFGTDQFIFFENNTGSSSTPISCAVDAQAGGRYVFRYHTSMTNMTVQTHGSEAQRERTGRAFEIYNNTLDGDGSSQNPIFMRGGVTLVHNNTLTNWSASATINLVDNRIMENLYEPMAGSDGRNPWDVNDAGNPLSTATATSAGTLTVTDSSKSWTVNEWQNYAVRRTSGLSVTSMTYSGGAITVVCTAHGFLAGARISTWGANQYYFNGLFLVDSVTDANTFVVLSQFASGTATGTIKAASGNNFAVIDSNTSTQLTFHDSLFGAAFRLGFLTGDTYEINKVTQTMDQPGVYGGTDLAGATTPAVPGSWNNQTVSACYEWSNTLNGVANLNFTNGRQGAVGTTFANIVVNTHYINDTPKPGYTPYVYPHPLVTGATNTIAVAGTTTVTGTLTLP